MMTLSSITGDVHESRAFLQPSVPSHTVAASPHFTHTFIPSRRFSPLHKYDFIVTVDDDSFPGSVGTLVQCERRER